MSSVLPSRADVLVIGAGPTGLALSISLLQAGVNVVLIDKLATGQTTSRAAVIHAHTLEALRDLGVADQLTASGLKIGRFSLRDRDQALVRLSFDGLPSDFPYLLMLPQDVTETILTQRLEALGGRIHRGVAATSVEQNADGVRVWAEQDGVRALIEARYVVGADGMHSLVRQSAGIAFDGGQYAYSFVLADARMDWPLGREEVSLFFADAGPVVVAPLPNGRFRIVAAMEDAPEQPTAADIQRILDAHGPHGGGIVVHDVTWSSRFRLHHRLAQSYRKGRLLIMGDAAHVHSPAGGQGMNTGLVDATVLGRLLGAVVSGKRKEGVLDQYEKLRRPAAQKVMRLVGGLTAMAMTKSPAERGARNFRLALIGALPPARRAMIMNLSGLNRRTAAHVRL